MNIQLQNFKKSLNEKFMTYVTSILILLTIIIVVATCFVAIRSNKKTMTNDISEEYTTSSVKTAPAVQEKLLQMAKKILELADNNVIDGFTIHHSPGDLFAQIKLSRPLYLEFVESVEIKKHKILSPLDMDVYRYKLKNIDEIERTIIVKNNMHEIEGFNHSVAIWCKKWCAVIDIDKTVLQPNEEAQVIVVR